MEEAKEAPTPISKNIYDDLVLQKMKLFKKGDYYKILISSLLHLTKRARRSISLTAGLLSQYTHHTTAFFFRYCRKRICVISKGTVVSVILFK